MAESSNWSLTTLPLLVLVGIAEALCPHCTEDPEERDWEPPIHSDNSHAVLSRTQALASLAATCKDLHYIVLPILYHQAQCYPHQRIPLLRTLNSRPDLASRVKVLRLDFRSESDKRQLSVDDDIKDFLLGLAKRHGWIASVPYRLELEDPDALETYIARRTAEDLPVNLLIAACPNLEKVSTDVGYDHRFDVLKPATLPHLKDAALTPTDHISYLQLGIVSHLFFAAPSLERLTGHNTVHAGPSPLPLANLRHLHLERGSMSSHCLSMTLRSCPRLESFTFHVSGIQQITVPQLMKLLLRDAPQLKHLDLDLNYADMLEDEDEDNALNWDEDFPEPEPGFASFSHLQTLAISGDPLFYEWSGQPQLATLLPSSLRSLRIVDETQCVPGIWWNKFASPAALRSLPYLTLTMSQIGHVLTTVIEFKLVS